MSRICRIITCIVLLMGTLTIGLVVSGAEPQQRAKVTVEPWPPWIDMNAQGEVTGGIAIELFAEMLKRMNVEMVPEFVPFKRALAYIEDGTSDFILLVGPSPEREPFMVLTDPILMDSYRLCYSTDKFPTFEWNEWEELKPYTIGVVRGYFYGDAWKNAVDTYHFTLDNATSDLQNAKKLLGQRFDFLIILGSTIPGLFNDLPEAEKKMKCASKPIKKHPLCFGLSKKSALVSRLPEMNTILQQMKQDGTFKRILKDFYQEEP